MEFSNLLTITPKHFSYRGIDMSRAQQITQERRRRNSDGLAGKRNRLSVNENSLDRENFVYRFVNDIPGRIHNLTVNDDWEVVQDRENQVKNDGTGTGSEVAVQVGSDVNGKPARAVLLRKKKDWYEDDKRSEQRLIDATEDALKAGETPGASSDGSYAPKGGIVFENGAKS